MKIAIYARKSRLSDKGESINNQVSACKNYIKHCLAIAEPLEFIIYKDEGFSGSNTDRPEFKRMLQDAKYNLFNKLICYRLDRVSRNIADFSNTYELLEKHHIEFVSVKEQFDTSTPIGRAMLNIAMVFAQLERETIAERIKDNMLQLAKTGRWLGGRTPTGFVSKQVSYRGDVNTKKMYQLNSVPKELITIEMIYSQFLELKSLRGVESYLLTNDIFTPNKRHYTATTLKDILTNPVYCAADEVSYHYFQTLSCNVCNPKESFKGKYGIMAYNRTDQTGKTNKKKPTEDWIIAVGKHQAVIPGSKWVFVQQLLKTNTKKQFYNKEGMSYGILSGIIKCKVCGATMKVKKGKLNKEDIQCFAYVCSTKDLSHKKKCEVKNIIGQEADQDVLTSLLALIKDQTTLNKPIHISCLKPNDFLPHQSLKKTELEKDLNETETQIDHLLHQMMQFNGDDPLLSLYTKKLKELGHKKLSLNEDIEQINVRVKKEALEKIDLQQLKKSLKNMRCLLDSISIKQKRLLVRSLVQEITWDGETLQINLLGQKI